MYIMILDKSLLSYKWKWSSQKKFWGSNGIWTHDLCDTGTMLYQLSYKALLESGQVQVHIFFI